MKKSRIVVIGIVVTIIIFLGIWGINFLRGKNLFKNEQQYFILYDRIDGLTVASPVMMNGYKIGSVSAIRFFSEEKGNLLVTVSLGKKFKIPKKSTIQIFNADLMGTKAIQVLRSNSNLYHQTGDTLTGNIEGELKDQIDKQVQPLKIKIENMLSSLDSVLTVIRYTFNEQTRKDLAKSFASIKNTISNIEHATLVVDSVVFMQRGRLERILSNVESISTNIRNNNQKLNNIIQNFSQMSDSLAKANLVSVIRKTDVTLQKVNSLVDKINNGKGSISLLLNDDSLYVNLQHSSQNLNRLLVDIRENPKRYIHFSLVDRGKTYLFLDSVTLKKVKKDTLLKK